MMRSQAARLWYPYRVPLRDLPLSTTPMPSEIRPNMANATPPVRARETIMSDPRCSNSELSATFCEPFARLPRQNCRGRFDQRALPPFVWRNRDAHALFSMRNRRNEIVARDVDVAKRRPPVTSTASGGWVSRVRTKPTGEVCLDDIKLAIFYARLCIGSSDPALSPRG
jgi:hypothetical protein